MRIRFAILALTLQAARAQSAPNVADILKKVAAAYRVTQYDLVVEGTEVNARTSRTITTHARFAFRAPDRYRLEGPMPGLISPGSDPDRSAVVDDGSELWLYVGGQNQYREIPVSELAGMGMGDVRGWRPEALDHFVMWRYRDAATFAPEATMLGRESIPFDGGNVDCYMILVAPKPGGPKYTWWVDTKRYFVLREDNADTITRYTSIRLGEPLPDDLFKFVPPAGARKR